MAKRPNSIQKVLKCIQLGHTFHVMQMNKHFDCQFKLHFNLFFFHQSLISQPTDQNVIKCNRYHTYKCRNSKCMAVLMIALYWAFAKQASSNSCSITNHRTHAIIVMKFETVSICSVHSMKLVALPVNCDLINWAHTAHSHTQQTVSNCLDVGLIQIHANELQLENN